MKSKKWLLAVALIFVCSTLPAQNKNISGGTLFDGEPYLAINPKNPQNMVVAWMGYKFGQEVTIRTKATFDGGKTWGATYNLPHLASTHQSADPSLVFDKNGKVYACYVDYRKSPDSGSIYLISSADGGKTWGNGHVVSDMYSVDAAKRPIDRPWLSIDNSGGAYNGRLYVTCKPAPWINPPCRPYYTYSANGGSSWTSLDYVDTTGFLVGNLIQGPMAAHAVTAGGTFVAVYPSYLSSQKVLPAYYAAISTNGGSTFTYKTVYSAATGGSDSLAKVGYMLLADPSNAAHLAFVFPAKINGDLDVYCCETWNTGNTWSNPVRINSDAANNGVMQDLVWGAFDTDGDLVITWRDRRNGAGSGYRQSSEIWAAWRHKDSSVFSANFKLSDTLAKYNELYLAGSGNDFMCAQLQNDTVHSVWGDVRSGKLEIWYQKTALGTKQSSSRVISAEQLVQVKAYPVPAGNQLFFEGEDILEIGVYNALGAKVWQHSGLSQMVILESGKLPAGNYSALVKTRIGNTRLSFTVDPR